MSRFSWAAAGVSVLTFALTPVAALAADPDSSDVRSVGAHARNDIHRGLRPALRRSRHLAARAVAQRPVAGLLASGSGFSQAAGSERVRVRVLQRRLAAQGFTPGPIDGLYGPLTTRAVIDFQAAHGLRTDGVVGPETLMRLHVTVLGGPLTALLPTRHRRAHLRPTASVVARSPRPVYAHAGTPPAPLRQLQNPAVTNHPQAKGHALLFWLMLAGLIAASVLSIGAALSRRSRVRPRRRHYIGAGKLAIARHVGFRYCQERDAYIFRLAGNRFGPVLKISESVSILTPETRGSATAGTATRRSRASSARSGYGVNLATQDSQMKSSATSPKWSAASDSSSPTEVLAAGDTLGSIRTAVPPAAPQTTADFTPAVRSARRIASGSARARPSHQRSSLPSATAALLTFAGLGLRRILHKNEHRR